MNAKLKKKLNQVTLALDQALNRTSSSAAENPNREALMQLNSLIKLKEADLQSAYR